LEDMDHPPGLGAFVGRVHGAILKALGCIGHVTNGAVRELPSVAPMGIQLFAGNVAVSHAYAHIFDIGAEVKVDGLEIRPGDLLHGDRHGVLNVPISIAAQIPGVAKILERRHQRIVEFCDSNSFSVAGLSEMLEGFRKSD